MTGDCRHCRDWRMCVGKEVFLYSEIRFCTHQMIWLITNLGMLEQGDWPDQADDSSPGRISAEASFTKAVEMAAETKTRLDSLPKYARDHLRDLIDAGIEIDNMSYTPRMALYYISGQRKDMNFTKWCWQRRHRKSEDKTSSRIAKMSP